MCRERHPKSAHNGEERKVSDARRARPKRDQNATAKKGSRAKETTFFYDDDDAQFLNTLADGISFVLSTNARLRNEDTHNTQKKSRNRKERVFSFRSTKKKKRIF